MFATRNETVTVTDESYAAWWRGISQPPPAPWIYMFELFTGEDTAEEWAMAAAVFVAQHRRRHSRGPTFRELFENLLPETAGVPSSLPASWDLLERRRGNSGFRLHSAIEWRRRGYIGFDRGIKHTLRVGPRFRERSRSLHEAQEPERRGPQARADQNHRSELRPGMLRDLSADEVIEQLRITPRYLKRLSEKGFLHVVTHEGKPCFPGWQFNGDRLRSVVPGINVMSSAIPSHWSLARIRAFMATRRNEFQIDGRDHTAVEWLLRGGDPSCVTKVLQEHSP